MPQRKFHVYILTNKSRTLYIGKTSNLHGRLEQHCAGAVPGFTRRYGIKTLVYVEEAESAMAAAERERQLKGWRRSKKLGLIDQFNPMWRDLSRDLLTG